MRGACLILIAAAGFLTAAQTSTSKATQAGETTPKTSKTVQDDWSGTTGSDTGMSAAAPVEISRGISRKHRKHRRSHHSVAAPGLKRRSL